VASEFDLDAYFERIGWTGSAAPTLQNLCGVVTAHMRQIPFDNLDVLLGRPPRLDLGSLQAKLVRAGRGGYCFEHMTLFGSALEAMEFEVASHSARVVWNSSLRQAARQHMFVTVSLGDAVYVLDPGFGGPAPTAPVLLTEGGPDGPAGASHWMHREGDYWALRHRHAGQGEALWMSTLERDQPIDFEMANYFVSTHPRSLFTNNLMMSRFTPDGRIGVRNRNASIKHGAQTSSFEIADLAALRAFLFEHFGLDLPEVETLRVPAVPEWNALT
jgi:N-hydroxyarylamine O-acetyltransferase